METHTQPQKDGTRAGYIANSPIINNPFMLRGASAWSEGFWQNGRTGSEWYRKWPMI